MGLQYQPANIPRHGTYCMTDVIVVHYSILLDYKNIKQTKIYIYIACLLIYHKIGTNIKDCNITKDFYKDCFQIRVLFNLVRCCKYGVEIGNKQMLLQRLHPCGTRSTSKIRFNFQCLRSAKKARGHVFIPKKIGLRQQARHPMHLRIFWLDSFRPNVFGQDIFLIRLFHGCFFVYKESEYTLDTLQ